MANEFKHGSVGTELTQGEYEAVGGHVLDSQAIGDLIYATSAIQLSRLGIGATGAVLTVTGGVPAWDTTWTPTGHLIPAADDSYDLGSAAAAWQDLYLEGDISLTDAGSISTAAGALTIGSAAAINITPTAGSAILLDGTISIDAGVVTGATSITSTAFAGALTGNVTGNASGTAATVTSGTQAAITTLANVTTVGALDAGSISTNFGVINNGASAITTTGLVSAGSLTVTGTTTLNGNLILGDAATDTLTLSATIQGATPLIFEGASAGDYETSFAITDPSADRTITFPDATLTVNAAANISGTTLASNVVTSSLTTVGALGSGTIGTGFGTINNGASSITTTGTLAAGATTLSGNLILGDNLQVVIGHTAAGLKVGAVNHAGLQISDNDNSTSANISIANFQTADSPTEIYFGKGTGATTGVYTAITTGWTLGRVAFTGADGTDMDTHSAMIAAVAEGTIGTGRIPSRMEFYTGTDAASTVRTKALTLDSSQNATFAGDVIMGAKTAYIGDTANANMTVGLTINQGANSNAAFELKATNVAQQWTAWTETDTYFSIKQGEPGAGGARITGLKDADGGASKALMFDGFLGEAADTTDTTGSGGVVHFNSFITNGTTGVTSIADAGNIFVVTNNDTARLLVKGNGDLHVTNTTLVALDDEDDIDLIRRYQWESSNGMGIAMSKWDAGLKSNRADLIRTGVWSSQGDFTVQQRMNDLLGGGIWQLNTKHMSLAEKVDGLEVELIEAKKQLAAISA